MKRPKSAVLLSLPYNFQNKQQAIQMKQRIKKSLLTFESQQSINYPNPLVFNQTETSCRSYIDKGPSLLNSTAAHYTVYQNHSQYKMANSPNSESKSNAFNRYSTAISCASISSSLKGSRATMKNTRSSSKQVINNRKAFKKVQKMKCENYFFFQPQKLQPCRLIKKKSRQTLKQCLKKSNQETDFINRIFLNYPQPKMSNSRQILKQFQINRSKIEPSNSQSFLIDGKPLCNMKQNFSTNSCYIYSQNFGSSKLVKKCRALLKKNN